MKIKNNYFYTKLNFNEEEWLNHLYRLKNESINKTDYIPKKKDKIIILQTCSKEEKDTFIIVSAYRI